MVEIGYLLFIANLLGGKIKGIWKYVTRILISYFVKKEIIDDLDFGISIQKAAEEGFVNIINNEIILTPTGKQYLEAIQSKLKFSNEIQLQILKLKSFSDEEIIDYTNSLEEGIKNILEYVKSRKISLSDNIITNGFIGEINGKIFMLTLTSKEYVRKRDFSGKGTLAKIIQKLCKDEGTSSYCHLGYDKIVVICDKEPPKDLLDKIKGLGFEIIENMKKDFWELENRDEFLCQIITDHLQRKKLVKISKNMRFIDFSKDEEINVSINGIETKMRLFYGFNLKLKIFPQYKKFILWLDPTYVHFFTLDKWIEFNDFENEKEIIEKLSDEYVLVLPRRIKGKIIEIDTTREIEKDIKDHWLEKYNLQIKNNKGMAKIKFDWQEKPLEYPLETITFRKEWIEKKVGIIEKDDPTLHPKERLNKIREYIRDYFDDIRTNFIEIKLDKELLNLKRLKPFIKDYHRLLPPGLVFSQKDPLEYRSNDTRAIFKFGPYSNGKKIFISKIICPSNITITEIEEFLTKIKRTYDVFFGRLEFDLEEIRFPYGRKLIYELTYPWEIYNKLKEKIKIKTPKGKEGYIPIVIAIIPSRSNFLYYYLKGLIINQWMLPDQHIREDSFRKIKEGQSPLTRNLCLQLYLKSLKHTEVPWILEFPSDKNSETIYCGIGYSMRMDQNNVRKGIGVFSICDAQGKYVYQKSILLPDTSYYLSDDLLNRVFKFLEEKTEDIKFKRVVIYKKGKLTKNEKKIAIEFLNKLTKSKFWKNKKIDIISVEESINRLFKISDNLILNVDHGVSIILNEKEGIICTSGHPDVIMGQGTIKLLKINLEVINSHKGIEDVIQEYYDRTFLNWMAPITLSKYPPELKIANNIAEMMKEVEINREFPYIVV